MSLVNGAKSVVDVLLDHRTVRAVSFVGSTPVAKYIYARGSASGKRVQCQGGAKNHVVVLADADMETTTQIVSDSAFGCAGQRCLAVSVAITVGEAKHMFRDAIAASAGSIRVGSGLEESTQMGPVITRASKARIEDLIARGKSGGKSGHSISDPGQSDGALAILKHDRTTGFTRYRAGIDLGPQF